MPDGNVAPVFAGGARQERSRSRSKEPTGGGGNRMHHKFVVIDFDKPTARVYLGSYNFSNPADTKNGENLLLIRDRRIAVSYMIEALAHFRPLPLPRRPARRPRRPGRSCSSPEPPRKAGEKPWWDEDYTDPRKIRDRQLFAWRRQPGNTRDGAPRVPT